MGEVFAGRYELVDPIGRGGVGAVWRAWDHRRRRYVAAKVLQQSDAHTLLRFVREQAVRIDHPHVLAPASWAADDDKVLFTMDLVSGGSLAHVIGDYGPLPPQYVCGLLDQLLAGLAAVHAEGVVHRDIKPANVLMEATGTGRPHLRLSDFGISMRKGEPRLTETNYVVGTPGYFAPEQMTGAEPDFTADLFAVGLVAIYLIEGQKPDSKALVEHFVTHGTPGAPQSIPEPLWQVLAGLLQPDPEDRFRSATGARKALATAVEMLPELGPDDEPVEIFDQLGPLPIGFGPKGPERDHASGTHTGRRARSGRTPAIGRGSSPSVAQPPETGPHITGPPAVEPHATGFSGVGFTGAEPSGDPPAPMPPGTGPSASGPARASGDPSEPQPPPLLGSAHQLSAPPQFAQLPPGLPPSAGHAPSLSPPPHALVQPQLPPAPAGGLAVPPPPPQPPTPLPHPAQPSTPPPIPAAGEPTPTPTPAPLTDPLTDHGASPFYTHAPEQLPRSNTTPTAPVQYQTPLTRTYTAQSPQVPLTRAEARRAAKRPGPPLRVAVPVLFLALICYTVGFWALSQVN
ncbi:serine/threonine protein kinase [Streptomyces albipurpureus]|uniref:non-specific serine/threonine protein kinase n=1 Tax=Streptomyces albipurpureus TaxID=2897419 RepID=A0ABT0UNJ7_9ACTN|nr:serine/threonine protein kinase [Streptomyces sp. CWNU-1]MCM2388826.1 protein kinase [Streptomyces sp. CWNU-1]